MPSFLQANCLKSLIVLVGGRSISISLYRGIDARISYRGRPVVLPGDCECHYVARLGEHGWGSWDRNYVEVNGIVRFLLRFVFSHSRKPM